VVTVESVRVDRSTTVLGVVATVLVTVGVVLVMTEPPPSL
jgi:hypothetical protein